MSSCLTMLERSSVCPSVTLAIHAYIVQNIEISFTPYDRAVRVSSFLMPNFAVGSFKSLPLMSVLERGTPVESKTFTNNTQ